MDWPDWFLGGEKRWRRIESVSRDIVTELKVRPGTQPQIMQRLGYQFNDVSTSLRYLVGIGAVSRTRVGRTNVYNIVSGTP